MAAFSIQGFVLLLGMCIGTSDLWGADDVSVLAKKYLGDWETTIEWTGNEPGSKMQWKGTSSSKMVGSNWVASRHSGDFLGMGYEAAETLGFDSEKQAWISIWVSRMQNSARIMTGDVTPGGRLRLEGKLQDEKTGEWLDIVREDCWINTDRFISRFDKRDQVGALVEVLTVTHDRALREGKSTDETVGSADCLAG